MKQTTITLRIDPAHFEAYKRDEGRAKYFRERVRKLADEVYGRKTQKSKASQLLEQVDFELRQAAMVVNQLQETRKIYARAVEEEAKMEGGLVVENDHFDIS